jgi:hypothetical protein
MPLCWNLSGHTSATEITEHLNNCLSQCDPDLLTAKIAGQGMTAFFYNTLTTGNVVLELPAGILKKWQSLAAGTALHNMLYEEKGSLLLNELGEKGIRCILLKGFSRMERLYGNTWTRPVSDLDILITREDYPLVRDYLLGSGFRFSVKEAFRDRVKEAVEVSDSFYNEIQFVKDFGKVPFYLDLHWRIEGIAEGSPLKHLYPLEGYPWRQHTERQSIGGTVVECLSLEMQFIHAVFHFALHHRFQGLKWFLDICLFIKEFGKEMNWDFISDTVREPDCRKLFGITLRLVSDTAGETSRHIPSWKKFWSGTQLPGEYNYYRQRLLSGHSLVQDYLTYVFLPLKVSGKIKVLSYFLFHKEAVRQWRQKGSKSMPPVLQPFYILYRAGAELVRKAPGKSR